MSCVHFPIWLCRCEDLCAPKPWFMAQSHPHFYVLNSSPCVIAASPHSASLSAPIIPAGAIVATKSESSVHSPATSILAGHCHPCPMLPLPPPHTIAHNTFVVQVSGSCCKLFRIFSTNLVYGPCSI
jgi:hypothetical protein